MRTAISSTAVLAILLTLAGGLPASAETAALQTGMIPAPLTLSPDADAKALVVLLSDADGWQSQDQTEAERLRDNGAMVIGIDTPKYLLSLAKDPKSCVYTVSDIEALGHQLQRQAGNETLLHPIIAGRGEGGALALAILAQTPKTTFSHTLALDPQAGIPLKLQLCTPAAKQHVGDGMVYGLTPGDLPDPATVLFSADAPADGRSHVAELVTSHPDIRQEDISGDPDQEFSDALDRIIAEQDAEETPLGLPLTILETKPALDTMAVVYSGDGGWRDIDNEVAANLQASGIPVVGVDSLRYFWSKKSPEQTSRDLATILETYRERFQVRHILLVGYSFGADILPAAYNALPADLKDRVTQMSLLALSHQVDYEISVTGWLGASSDSTSDPLNDIAKMDPKLVQCIYGADDEDDACHVLKGGPVETIKIDGGHHFDGDYPALTNHLISGLKARLPAAKVQ